MNILKNIREAKREIPQPFTLTYDFESGMSQPAGQNDIPFSTNVDVIMSYIRLVMGLRKIARCFTEKLDLMYGDGMKSMIDRISDFRCDEDTVNECMGQIEAMVSKSIKQELDAEDILDMQRVEADLDTLLNEEEG